MKTSFIASLQVVALATTLLVVPSLVSAQTSASTAKDPAALQLALVGSIPVKTAGLYVERGTYQIQVSTKLGRPSFRLPDGAWLYENFRVDGSEAGGSLLVHFISGRVSDLSLVSPAIATALMNAPKADRAIFAAAQSRR